MPTGYVNIYECPRGCKAQGGKPIAASIRGWKKHMTRQHGGYDETELATIVGAAPPDTERRRELFLSEADGIPTNKEAGESSGAQDNSGGLPPQPDTVNIKKEQMARKLNAKLSKFKDRLTKRAAAGLDLVTKDKGDTWQVDEDDKEFFEESLENCLEILEIDFQVKPISKTIENPLWVLLLPVIALLWIFVPKALKVAAEQKEKSDSE